MAVTEEQVIVKVDGARLEREYADLVSVAVEQSLLLPDAFTLVLVGGLGWMRDDSFAIGREVSIEMGQGSARRELMTGEITGLFPRMTSRNHVELTVRGYDRSHRLLRGRHTRAFVQVSDSDIAQRIASELGLGADVETTREVHPYVLQHNETNLDFLQKRAARIGFEAGVSGRDLYFKPIGRATNGGERTVRLKWGEELEEFEASLTTPGQATQVTVRGWDMARKEAVVGQAERSEAGPQTRRRRSGSDIVRAAFGVEAPLTVVRDDVTSQAAAESLAQVINDELHGALITAEGVTFGNPLLAPGVTVEIEGVGVFDGSYLVSSVRHTFTQSYRTSFSVGGARQPPPVLPMAAPRTRAPGLSLTVGIVTNNEDPEGMGRVKVKFPSLADDLESDWARLVTPMAGPDRGLFLLPEVNDEVLVAFEPGSSGRPYVLGSLWNGADAPPASVTEAVGSGRVEKRYFKTRSGHILLFDDKDGDEKLTIQDRKGNKITFECSRDKLVIEAAGDIEIEAGGRLALKAGSGLAVEAGTNLSLKAQASLDVEASGTLGLKGASVGINDNAVMVT